MWAQIVNHFPERCPGSERGALDLPEALIFVWKVVTTGICDFRVFEFPGEMFPPGKGGMG